MKARAGEVAIHRHGQTHAVKASALGEAGIDVDLEDDDFPVVSVPKGVGVKYLDPEDDLPADLETDGGVTVNPRTESTMRGVGLAPHIAQYTFGAGLLLTASGGWLWGGGGSLPFVGAIAVGSGILAACVGSKSYFGGDAA